MPRSKTRKKPAPRQPDLSKPIVRTAAEAEAVNANIAFEWRGAHFVIDIVNVQFGRAQFAIRVMGNESLPLMTRMDAMLDVMEAALGQEQLRVALELAPDVFDNEATMKSFWEAYTKAAHGAASGESQAS